jgi:hypothetical protein
MRALFPPRLALDGLVTSIDRMDRSAAAEFLENDDLRRHQIVVAKLLEQIDRLCVRGAKSLPCRIWAGYAAERGAVMTWCRRFHSGQI